MERSKVTSAEVAARAGVSQSAVSRVFTPGASASQVTVEKVRKAAADLGYRPNVLARAMVSGKSRIIGLVVAYLDNQFYPLALELLSNALQARNYHILIFTATNSIDDADAVVEEMMDYQVDAIITASVSISSTLAGRAKAAEIPVVLFNRGQDDSGLSSVTSANFEGGRRAAEFLLAGGHRRIAHIAGWQGSSTGRDRQAGFVQALDVAGVSPVAVVDGMYKRAVAMDCARTLVLGAARPDAIFVGNDHMAFAVMDAVREAGLVPGHDLSVMGYDDVPMASWGAYDLTTIRQPINRMVDAAVTTILEQIETPGTAPQQIEIEGDLRVRSSARVPKGWKT